MHDKSDDRDLVECFNLIYELYPEVAPSTGSTESLPSLAESRDMMRLFARIESPELRTAVRMLMRTLAAEVTSDDPIDPRPSAASKPN